MKRSSLSLSLIKTFQQLTIIRSIFNLVMEKLHKNSLKITSYHYTDSDQEYHEKLENPKN